MLSIDTHSRLIQDRSECEMTSAIPSATSRDDLLSSHETQESTLLSTKVSPIVPRHYLGVYLLSVFLSNNVSHKSSGQLLS